MTIKVNGFENGANGTTMTPGSGGNTGGSGADFLDVVTAGGGSTAFSTAAAHTGLLGARMTLGGSSTYMVWNEAQAGPRWVVRRSFKMTSTPTGDAGVLSIRNSGGSPIGQIVMKSTGIMRLYVGGAANTSSDSPTLTAGTLYWVELAAKKEVVAGDGVVAMNITNAAGSVIHTFTISSASTGTADAATYRLGSTSTAIGWTVDDIDEIQAGPLASGWLGPVTGVSLTAPASDVSLVAIPGSAVTTSNSDTAGLPAGIVLAAPAGVISVSSSVIGTATATATSSGISYAAITLTGSTTAAASTAAVSASRLVATGSTTANATATSFARTSVTGQATATATSTATSTVVTSATGTSTVAATSTSTATTAVTGSSTVTASNSASSFASGGAIPVTGSTSATASVTGTSFARIPVAGTLTATAALIATTFARAITTGSTGGTATVTAVSSAVAPSPIVTGSTSATATLTALATARHYLTGLTLATASASSVSADAAAPTHPILTISAIYMRDRTARITDRPRTVTLTDRPRTVTIAERVIE